MTGVTKRPHSPEKEPKESPVKQTKLDVVKQDVEESDSDDDGDFGPLPAEEDSTDAISGKRRKRVRGIS